jgi:hypothetical protein
MKYVGCSFTGITYTEGCSKQYSEKNAMLGSEDRKVEKATENCIMKSLGAKKIPVNVVRVIKHICVDHARKNEKLE